jgi:hypothetical protein
LSLSPIILKKEKYKKKNGLQKTDCGLGTNFDAVFVWALAPAPSLHFKKQVFKLMFHVIFYEFFVVVKVN